jgi:hypothetical protein
MARARPLLRRTRRAALARGLLLVGVLLTLGLRTVLAAYACAMPSATMEPSVAAGASAGHAAMRGACAENRHAAADRLLCAQHCAAQATAPSDSRPMAVPPNRLAATPPVWPHLALHVPTTPIPERRYRLRAPPPPLPLLFCTLLI